MSYAELHCISNFTFLRGASHPRELVNTASELGYKAIAITDECSLAGVVKAHVAAQECNLPLIIGSEFQLNDHKLVVLVTNHQSYSELSALITLTRRRSRKGSYSLEWPDLSHNLSHCLLIWLPSGELDADHPIGEKLSHWFMGRLWIGVEHLLDGNETEQYYYSRNLAALWQVPMVACGDVHMHCKQRQLLQDTLTAIRFNCSVMQLGKRRFANAERRLRSLPHLKKIYPPALLAETVAIAKRCHFSLTELRYEYPSEVVPNHLTAGEQLCYLVTEGIKKRWPNGPSEAVNQQIKYELTVISELNYESYFLTVHDLVAFARSRDILCQGRGSAANSVVCYCLFITEVSPDQVSLLFERFISKERNEPPDIDVDFEHERREEVIQYIYKRYGRERAAIAATVITYRPRSAVRDVGKALGLDALFIEQLSQSLSWWDRRADLEKQFNGQRIHTKGASDNTRLIDQFYQLLQDILGFPRHLSQHVGGFIITRKPISALVPLENASMPERTVIQWDKTDIATLGLLKIDILALGILTAIHRCFELIQQHQGISLDMQTIPKDDIPTFDMLCKADSIGVFQIESRAQMAMLPRLKPRCFYDLVIEIAIVRPGPIQGGMVHPYLKRRQGLETISYPSPEIKAVLERTLGIPVFQEQVIRLAMVAAGFSGGEADQLRRAMASWSSKDGNNNQLTQFEQKLTTGMLAQGYSLDFAQRLFKQIQGFGVYGFPESHSASFALLAYVSAWLKCHYPAAYCCAIMNSQPMGFYSSSQLVQDAQRHNIHVSPIDVNYSEWDHTLYRDITLDKKDKPLIRLGFRIIKGLPYKSAKRIFTAPRPFANLEDLALKARLSQVDLSLLSSAGALQSLTENRRQAHLQALAINNHGQLLQNASIEPNINLKEPSETDNLYADYNTTGLTLGRHPMSILRDQFPIFRQCKRHSDLAELGHQRFVRMAGIVTGKQRPGTASGVIFLTLEDETGNSNIVIWKSVQQRCRQALLKAQLLMVKGVIETDGEVVHIIAQELTDCSELLYKTTIRSRNFR
ncbi:MAG: error-prone DNA polymerase [Proteobacteria bacterium]|nr:error-prone DNA polymerase [Pseudomonadota bacterium]MDA1351110.1 error-prone DNA polymerase [Pseudomonadota bacterium]